MLKSKAHGNQREIETEPKPPIRRSLKLTKKEPAGCVDSDWELHGHSIKPEQPTIQYQCDRVDGPNEPLNGSTSAKLKSDSTRTCLTGY